jgi:hypothetical protein
MVERAKSLTDEQVAAAEPRPEAYRLSDGKGLYLEVTPTGLKVWRCVSTRNGRRKLHKLGEYPLMSLDQARLERQKVRLAVQKGRNPALKRTTAGQERVHMITDEALVKLGQRLIWLRQALDYTQADFAGHLRLSVTSCSQCGRVAFAIV